MKKLVLAFVAVAAISFASCGNTQKPTQKADSTNVEKIDSVNSDSVQQGDSINGDSATAQK